MSKRITIVLAVLFFSGSIYSQVLVAIIFGDKLNSPNVEFGINVGLNYSTISNTPGTNMKQGLNIGPFFHIRITDRFYFHPARLDGRYRPDACFEP